MLKTAKVRPINGTATEEVLSQLVTQFAYLVDETGHLFEVLEAKNKELDRRLAALEKEGANAN